MVSLCENQRLLNTNDVEFSSTSIQNVAYFIID